MKQIIMAVGLALLFAWQGFAGEHSALARVTVYWHSKASGANAAWNGAQLREGHCAVDPKKIPYGSKVAFHDAECVAVDTGPDVVNRKAARSCGRSSCSARRHRYRSFFPDETEGACLGKRESGFHDGANSNARQGITHSPHRAEERWRYQSLPKRRSRGISEAE